MVKQYGKSKGNGNGMDADGTGAAAAIAVAIIGTSSHPSLTYTDFNILG